MDNRIMEWVRKFWKVFLGLAAVAAALTAGFQLRRDIVDFRATSTPPPTVSPSLTPIPANTNTPTNTPTITPTSTPGPFQFIVKPVQVNAGEDIRVVVQAWQSASCHLDFLMPNDKKPSIADGLGFVNPDSRAQCAWEWHIRSDTTPGTGSLVVEINDLKEIHEIEVLPPK